MKKPDFIIAGEARCGTTSLFETMILHPQILVPPPQDGGFVYENGEIQLGQKEPRFFDRNYDKGLDWYFNLFEDAPGTITGDGSTMYLVYPEVMDRIKADLPDVKLIVALRNPAIRAYSHFAHVHRINKEFAERYPTFEQFVDKEINAAEHEIIKRGLYSISIKHCFSLFDKSQILILKSEDLFRDPTSEFNKIFDFLGVDEHKLNLHHVRQSNAPKMDIEVRHRLTSFYASPNRQLYDLLGRDMEWQ